MIDLPWRLRTDWAVVVADPGCTVPGPVSTGSDADLTWSDGGGRCLVLAWQRDDGGSAAWEVDSRGITVVRGQLRRRGHPWTDPSGWARDVARHHQPGDDGDPFDALVGDGSVVSISAQGRGVVAGDPLGVSPVFRSRGRYWEVFASRGELCASLTDPGRPVRRDASAVQWLCQVGHVVGRSGGFAGVTTVEPGARIRLDPIGPLEVDGAEPWFDTASLTSLATDDLLDVISESILDQVTAGAGLGEEPPLLDLTGGKDSRLLLATAMAAGVVDRVCLRTVGGPGLADVRAAAGLASFIGHDHSSGFDLNQVPGSFSEKVDRFVNGTEGAVNVWSMKLRHVGQGTVRLSGVVGEALRADMMERAWLERHRERDDPAAMADFVLGRIHGGSSGLVNRELSDRLDAQLRHEVVAGGQERPERALSGLFLRSRGARYGGALLDHDSDHRIWALVDLASVRAAHALAPALRRDEDVHFRIIDRVSPELARFAFEGEGWAGGQVPDPVPIPAPLPASPPTAATPAPPPSPAKPADVITTALSRPNQDRLEWIQRLRDAGPNHPVWDLADRTKVVEAVEGFDGLRPKPRRELYAVATAHEWLDGSPAPLTPDVRRRRWRPWRTR